MSDIDVLNDLYGAAETVTEEIAKKQETSTKRDERLLELNTSKTIYFRMFPDVTDIKKPLTNLPYKVYNFKSASTGRMQYAGVTPSFYGKEDFLHKKQLELWDLGQKDRAKLLYPTDKRFVNVFIINDSSNEANNNTFKVYNYTAKPTDPNRPKAGSPMVKAIEELLNDPDSDITNRNLYSLGEDGVTFKMTIVAPEKKGDFMDVKISAFPVGKTVQGFKGFPADKLLNIYKEKSADIMSMVEPCKSDEELEKIYKTHVLGVSTQSTPSQESANSYFDDPTQESDTNSGSDEIPFDFETKEATKAATTTEPTTESGDSNEAEIAKLLAEMED